MITFFGEPSREILPCANYVVCVECMEQRHYNSNRNACTPLLTCFPTQRLKKLTKMQLACPMPVYFGKVSSLFVQFLKCSWMGILVKPGNPSQELCFQAMHESKNLAHMHLFCFVLWDLSSAYL